MLNVPEMFHRVPAPSRYRMAFQPPFGRQRHGTTSADSCSSFVGCLPCRFGDREFLFDQSRSFQNESPRWIRDTPDTVSISLRSIEEKAHKSRPAPGPSVKCLAMAHGRVSRIGAGNVVSSIQVRRLL